MLKHIGLEHLSLWLLRKTRVKRDLFGFDLWRHVSANDVERKLHVIGVKLLGKHLYTLFLTRPRLASNTTKHPDMEVLSSSSIGVPKCPSKLFKRFCSLSTKEMQTY